MVRMFFHPYGYALFIAMAIAFAWGAMGYWGGMHAAYKGYPRILSLLLCIPFGALSFVAVWILPPIAEGCERVAADQEATQEQAASHRTFCCPQCGRENSVTARVCPRCEHRFNRVASPK